MVLPKLENSFIHKKSRIRELMYFNECRLIFTTEIVKIICHTEFEGAKIWIICLGK